jgi:hypothetical protein
MSVVSAASLYGASFHGLKWKTERKSERYNFMWRK